MKSFNMLLAGDALLRLAGFMSYTIILGDAYLNQGRAQDMGFVSLATLLPSLLAMTYAGKWLNRWTALSATRSITVSRALVFASALFLPKGILALSLLAGLNGFLQQTGMAAKMSLDAEKVDKNSRTSYNAKKIMLSNLCAVAGPALGGWLLGAQGRSIAWLALSFITTLSAVALYFLRNDLQTSSPLNRTEDKIVSLRETLRYLKNTPNVFTPLIAFCFVAVILEIQAPLLFPFVFENYNKGADFAGFILGLSGLGGILGSLCVSKIQGPVVKVISSLIIADATLFLTFLHCNSIPLALILFSLLGGMGAITLIKVETLIQNGVAAAHRPFTFSLMQFAGGAGGAALAVGTGVLADRVGAAAVLSGAAITEGLIGVSLLFVGIYIVGRKTLSEADHA